MALNPQWLTAHADEFDLLHVHFGLESFSPDELRASVDAAHRAGRPVVYTVHDLENPQLVDQEPYRALLDVLVPAADHLITLTETAADEVQSRWSRQCTVLPHPTLIPELPAHRGQRDGVVRIGVHLRDLRPNIDAERAVHAAVEAADVLNAEGRVVEFDVLVNEHVRDDASADRIVAAAAGQRGVQVRRTPHLSDAEIEEWMLGLDLFVLPYRHGTHSGWVELCYDLGVPVAGTDVGHIRSQHPEEFSVIDLDDPETLAAAVRSVSDAASVARSAMLDERRRERDAERRAVRSAHADLFSSLLTGVSA